MHAINRSRFRRSNIGTDIDEIFVPYSLQHAVFIECGLNLIGAVGRARRGSEVFEAVFDPFERALQQSARGGEKNQVGIQPLLDAETSAAMRRGEQPQLIAASP